MEGGLFVDSGLDEGDKRPLLRLGGAGCASGGHHSCPQLHQCPLPGRRVLLWMRHRKAAQLDPCAGLLAGVATGTVAFDERRLFIRSRRAGRRGHSSATVGPSSSCGEECGTCSKQGEVAKQARCR